jgi:hypothetical protein
MNSFLAGSLLNQQTRKLGHIAVLGLVTLCLVLSGRTLAASSGGVPTLSASTTAVNFGNVIAGQTASQSLTLSSTGTAPVTISGTSIVGSLFTSSGIATPLTLNPGQTATLNLVFASPHASTFTGVLTIASNSSLGNIVVNMSAAGVAAPTLSAISCSVASMSAAGTDACTVSLTAAAPSGGTSVSLASNNAAVKVPASVTVPPNATSAGFTASVLAVTGTQTATLTAATSAGSSAFSLQLVGGVPTLSASTTAVNFGNVIAGQTASQSLTLSSTGTAPVTISGDFDRRIAVYLIRDRDTLNSQPRPDSNPEPGVRFSSCQHVYRGSYNRQQFLSGQHRGQHECGRSCSPDTERHLLQRRFDERGGNGRLHGEFDCRGSQRRHECQPGKQ